uniref:AAA+ ATPase domain-containing protein n=1 Tax=Leersia perrieri TaxID=77586 RepID=A0A0D9X5D1_9ORYZ
MAGAVVSASMGVMNPLLAKLTTLMGDEYKKLKAVRKQVSFLKDELSTMSAFLEKLAIMDDDDEDLDPLVKDWRNNVREMTYDIEDCIDDFMHRLGDANASTFIRRLKTLRVRHQIAKQIDELKARVVEANERRKRYELIDSCSKSSASVSVAVDPRITALYQNADNLVGLDGPTEKLVQMLTDAELQLMVVSIVGFGGLGKTTLAKLVYDKIGEQFHCKAFVSVSQRPDIARLLSTIESKLNIHDSSQACEVQDIIDRLRDYLKHKRYLIVVDDLWKQEAWNIISCAFPENGNGSRVIVTTRVKDVACWACSNHRYIYKMEPLNNEDSKRLFFKRVFGSEDGCSSRYEKVSSEILKKCGGLPLAIITIASLLACQPTRIMEKWENIRNSLGTSFGANPSLEGMRQILNLSYKNLPLYLRTCLLYLAKYPEDDYINMDDVVRQWIAEGFVRSSHGQDLEDVGKSYFNELINRGLIQPIQNNYEEVMGCRVHDMMLDLILRRCNEDNFIVDEDWLGSLSACPHIAEVFIQGNFWFTRVPRWINSLSNLTRLYLSVSQIFTDEVGILGELPSLTILQLRMDRQIKGTIMFGASGGSFPALEFLFLIYEGDVSVQLVFQEGVLPKLQKLSLLSNTCLLAPIGMVHLLSLQLIHVDISHYVPEDSETCSCDAAEHALRNAAQSHPNRPSLKLYRAL